MLHTINLEKMHIYTSHTNPKFQSHSQTHNPSLTIPPLLTLLPLLLPTPHPTPPQPLIPRREQVDASTISVSLSLFSLYSESDGTTSSFAHTVTTKRKIRGKKYAIVLHLLFSFSSLSSLFLFCDSFYKIVVSCSIGCFSFREEQKAGKTIKISQIIKRTSNKDTY